MKEILLQYQVECDCSDYPYDHPLKSNVNRKVVISFYEFCRMTYLPVFSTGNAIKFSFIELNYLLSQVIEKMKNKNLGDNIVKFIGL